MVALVRAHNNVGRWYWDPRIEPHAEYIQLWRPWMSEQDDDGDNDLWMLWTVANQGDGEGETIGEIRWGTDRNGRSHRQLIRLRIYYVSLLDDRPWQRLYRAEFEHEGRVTYLSVDEIGDSGRWRYWLADRREWAMGAGLLRAGIHGILDCLEDRYSNSDCEFVVDDLSAAYQAQAPIAFDAPSSIAPRPIGFGETIAVPSGNIGGKGLNGE